MIGAILFWLLLALPALMSVFGYLAVFSPSSVTMKLIGLSMMFFAGIVASAMLILMRLLSPTAFKLISAKLRKADLLLVFSENRKWIPLVGRFESGWVWIRDRLGFIVSSPDDVGYLDGVPTYVCFRGVGKTLNPKAVVDLQILERELGVEADKVRKAILTAIKKADDKDRKEVFEVVEEIFSEGEEAAVEA